MASHKYNQPFVVQWWVDKQIPLLVLLTPYVELLAAVKYIFIEKYFYYFLLVYFSPLVSFHWLLNNNNNNNNYNNTLLPVLKFYTIS